MRNSSITILQQSKSRYLVLSSLCFLIPGIYCLFNKLYLYAGLIFITSLVSANYWREATYSWRRNADLLVSKISFTVFLFTGLFQLRTMTPVMQMTALFLVLPILVFSYHMSCKLYASQKDHWYVYHMAFHFCVGYLICIVVYHLHLSSMSAMPYSQAK